MRVRLSHIVIVAIVTAVAALLMCGAAFSPSSGTTLQNPSPSQALPIKIDYPLEDSVFPPEITPPTFLWHDANESSKRWVLEISFAGVSTPLRINAPGDLLQRGQSDPDAGPDLALTLEQATTHTWKPDIATWGKNQASVCQLTGSHHHHGPSAECDRAQLNWSRHNLDVVRSGWCSSLLSRCSLASSAT